MANTTVQVHHDLEGITTPKLYLFAADGSGASVNNSGNGDTLTQVTNRKGAWRATIDEALDGVYYYEVRSGTTLIAWGWVPLENNTDTWFGVETHTEASVVNSGQTVVVLV